MPTLIRAMLERPDEPPTPLSRYIEWNGLFYLGVGLLLYAWPGAMAVAGAEALAGQEEGLLRTIGFTVALIGWFYVFGARTNRDSFALATVADRLVVPFFLAPLVLWGGVDPALVVPFAVLDPVLAVGAYAIWRRQNAE